MPVLLEVNTSQEGSKAGWKVDDDNFNFWVDQVGYMSELHNIMIRGLMSMPPYYTDGELSRPYFARLNHLRDKLQNHFPEITHLSMGTSQDYEVAVEEGATFLRIGTAIMGKRG